MAAVGRAIIHFVVGCDPVVGRPEASAEIEADLIHTSCGPIDTLALSAAQPRCFHA